MDLFYFSICAILSFEDEYNPNAAGSNKYVKYFPTRRSTIVTARIENADISLLVCALPSAIFIPSFTAGPIEMISINKNPNSPRSFHAERMLCMYSPFSYFP